MLVIEQHPVWCDVQKGSTHVGWLHYVLTISTKAFVRGRVHFYKLRLFDKRRMRFPSGLLPDVLKRAGEKQIPVEVVDDRPDLPQINPLPSSCSHLFDYQKAAVDACIEHKFGIVKLPTGSGKTELAVGLASRVQGSTLFLVDERALLRQAMERWEAITGEKAGIIGEGRVETARFTVSTFQSLSAKLKAGNREVLDFVCSVVCLMVDEAQVLGARTYYKTVISVPNAVFRIGLSATPTGRSDKRDAYVVGATGPVIYTIPISTLVDRGRLAEALVLFYKFPGAREMVGASGKWHRLYRRGIVQEDARNRAVVRICRVTPLPVLVFFEQKRHGYILLQMLIDAGFNAKIVHGAFKGKERIELAKALSAGDLDVLLCSKVFNKGIDIPGIKSAVNAAGYKAPITAMQKMGRPMRVAAGKTKFVFWDLVDKHHETLMRHSRERARVYRKEGLALVVVDNLRDAVQKIEQVFTPVLPPLYRPLPEIYVRRVLQ